MRRAAGPALGSLALAAAWLGLAAIAAGDVFVLTSGDRISGRVTYKGTRSFSVQTPYGRLTIPRAKIERILRDDGSEEVLNPPAAQPSPPPEPPVQLVLALTGKSFWYAWDPPKGETVDPTLRLELRLDEAPLAVFVDAKTDPDIPGAVVNAFSFAEDQVKAEPAEGARLISTEARPGRIALKLELPAERAGRRRLRLAYQMLDPAQGEQGAWRDVTEASLDLDLKADATTFVQVLQDGGRMEFSGFMRRRMKNVDSFRLELRTE